MGTCEGRVGWLAPALYMRCNGSNWAVYSPGSWDGFRNDVWALWAGVIMRLEHHLVGGYVRYISPYIILLLYSSYCNSSAFPVISAFKKKISATKKNVRGESAVLPLFQKSKKIATYWSVCPKCTDAMRDPVTRISCIVWPMPTACDPLESHHKAYVCSRVYGRLKSRTCVDYAPRCGGRVV